MAAEGLQTTYGCLPQWWMGFLCRVGIGTGIDRLIDRTCQVNEGFTKTILAFLMPNILFCQTEFLIYLFEVLDELGFNVELKIVQ